jgi:hypothetical protein
MYDGGSQGEAERRRLKILKCRCPTERKELINAQETKKLNESF